MLLPGMGQAGVGRGLPLLQVLVARVGVGRADRIGEPVIEFVGRWAELGAKSAQVVIAHSTAHDEHSLLPQWLQDAACLNVNARIESSFERELDDGNIRVWID